VKKKIGLLAAVILFAQTVYSLENIAFFKLTNGLKVIVSPMAGQKTVSIMTLHLNSVKDEPLDIKGSTFILKRLIEVCGSANLQHYERYRVMKRNGGEYAFAVQQDFSYLYQITPPNLLENSLWFEKERMESLEIPENFLWSQKSRITKQLEEMLADSVQMRAIRWIHRIHFKDTPYEYPVYGNPDELSDIPNHKIKRFYLTLTEPQNTVLIICGNITIADLKPILEKHFGEIQSTRISRTTSYVINQTVRPPLNTKKTEDWALENIKHPMVFYGFAAPPKFHSDFIIYRFLLYYLLDPRISKINHFFNIQNNLNTDIFKNFSEHVGINSLVVGFSVTNRLEMERIKFGMNELLQFLQTTKLSYNDINNTKTLMKIDYLKKLQDLQRRSELIAEHYYIYRDLEMKEQFMKKLNSITPFSIIRVAKNFFTDEYTKLNVYQK